MIKRTILAAAIALMGLSATAKPVPQTDAAKVARTFWAQHSGAKSAEALAPQGWAFADIHLFTHPQGGFVMVAADDVARPVLGWSPSSIIAPDALPPQLKGWLQGYQRAIALAREAGYQPPQAVADQWAALLAGIATKDGDTTGDTELPSTVSPLLSTTWDQDSPYSDLCPETPDPWAGTPWAGYMGGNAPTGCVATAQAQVMKYWNWPPFGEGSHSYSTSDLDQEMAGEGFEMVEFTDLAADFQHTLYGWADMLDSYGSSSGGWPWGGGSTSSGTAAQKHAVAELMLHVGISVQMIYGAEMSGAFCAYPDTDYYCSHLALGRHFRYDSASLRSIWLDSIGSEADWLGIVLAEVAGGRPVLYAGGSDEEGGHCFVMDGYDSQHRMHFNFGWSGSGDGYYAVSAISPGGGGIGGGSYHFSANQEAVVGITPLYGCRLSDARLHIAAAGADTTVLYMANPQLGDLHQFSSDQSWATLADTAATSGRMAIHISPNPDAAPRQALVSLGQGTELVTLTIVQDGTDEAASAPQAEATALQAYPNPSTGRLMVKAPGLTRVQVLDLEGRVLIDQASAAVDLTPLPAGAYLLRATSALGTATRRIVRQ